VTTTNDDTLLSTPELKAAARICVARHGETDWNSAGILQGWLDVPLNDRGRAQARELAASLSEAGLRSVVTSPLRRARETAEIVAERLGLPDPACHDGLKERHFGVVQGIPKSELVQMNPALYQQILSRNPASVFDDGETMDAFADRVLAALGAIAEANAGARVLVIAHGWTMDAIARHVQGLPRGAVLKRKPQNIDRLWLEATREAARPADAERPASDGPAPAR
jgi:probable phosphoglycerate mutase